MTERPAPAAVGGLAIVALLLLAGTLAMAGRWATRLPLPTTPDEAHYLKFLCHDHDAYAHGGAWRLAKAIVYDDRTRPPAYRLLVAPWVALSAGEPNFARLRLIALAWLGVAAGVVAATVQGLTRSTGAGLLAAAVGCLATKVVLSTAHFGTEYAIYLGTALTFLGLFRDWDDPSPAGALRWWPLALGLALSALSKASFLPLTALPLLIAAGLWWRGRVRGPGPAYLLKAVGAAAVVAGPWWVLNFGRAKAFAEMSLSFHRRSFGPAGVRTSVTYLLELARFEIGLPVALLMVTPLAAHAVFALRRRRARPLQVEPPRATPTAALAVLVLPAAALIALQMVSANQDGRLVSHAFLPLAMAAAVAAGAMGWLRSWPCPAVAVAGVMAQAVLMAGPPAWVSAVAARAPLLAVSHRPVLRYWPTWDWEPLRDACRARGLASPRVTALGNSNTFNSDQFEIPWALHGESIRSSQLWRWDIGPYQPDAIAAEAAKADVVLTAPDLVGDEMEHESLDNAHNREFAARLSADPAYDAPVRLTLGTTDPTAVDVYFRRPPAATRPSRP